ncbi:ATP-dependent DNA helicase srs2 [Drechslerella dactyloides]|uniref:DNA 3'-5' helicase n=1 Tax=Drechslerella dactyloides TaxID=74499 RepID=A0AAD6IRS5_DREDA|nr:ATP-dependent DNA helicase srs2 [Drechslerella dactyloides]
MDASSPSPEPIDVAKILHGLNHSQRDAVTSSAAILQILAPPGSGKTRTLTSRVAWMLANGMIPSNIIVATFTNKASKEMKERISKMIGGGLENRLIIGTFHSIATRYLRKYGHLIDIPREFGIADTSDSSTIITRIIKRNKYPTTDGNDAGNIRSRISTLKAKRMTVDEYILSQKKNNHDDEFGKIYKEYEKELKSSNLLDFDDLLLRCLDLLRQHPLCVSNIESVLIDEFQDTNLVQFDLMCLFAYKRNKITIVGDPDQSIYGFRAAEIGNLKTMKEVYPDTIVINLEENYRSSAAILHCSLEVIEQDKARPQKGITPTHEIGISPVLRKLPSPDAEARWIIQEILRLRALTGNIFKFSDVAILIRSGGLARDIEPQMNNFRIPYRLIAGTKFFERAEIKVVLDYLRVVVNPNNSEALAKVINVPPRRLGSKSIEGLVAEAYKRGMTVWTLIRKGVRGDLTFQTPITKPGERSLSQFIKIILDTQNLLKSVKCAEQGNVAPIIESLLEKINYKNHVESHQKPGEDRWPHVEELIVQATEFCNNLAAGIDEADLPDTDAEGNPSDESKTSVALGKFLANAALATAKDGPEVDEEDGEGVLTISTIHNAKGLEWPIVFVPGCYTGSIPHSRSDDTDEERRLLYVAMTRAQTLLYLSYPCELRDRKSGDKQESNLCDFLAEGQLAPLMTSKGPVITPQTILSFSKIMARDCPSAEKVKETLEAAQLHWQDDWVESDDPPGTVSRTMPMNGYNVYQPRGGIQGFRSIGQAVQVAPSSKSIVNAVYSRTDQFSVNRTTVSSGFSTTTTTMQGFTSANSHRSMLAGSQLECEADIRRQVLKRKSDGISAGDSNESQPQNQSKNSKPKTAKNAKTKPENTLMNFFSRQTDTLPPPTARPLVATSGNSSTNASRKPEKDENLIYLSSSPERPPPRPEIVAQNRELQERMRRNPPIKGFPPLSSISSSRGSSSYAAPTTISRMAATVGTVSSSGTAAAASSSSAPRKTLGMRRAMSGWSDRQAARK